MKTILWSRDTIDWRDKDASLIYSRATKNIKGGEFVLMHPMKETADALDDILTYYETCALRAVTVSENLQDGRITIWFTKKDTKTGFGLVVKQMEGLLSVTMGILVGTGSSAETDAEDGISHFIEHMQFKGTKKRTSFEISDAFDRIGAQVNAFTGKDMTCYYSKCTSDHTAEAFEILSDLFPEQHLSRRRDGA